MDLLRLRSPIFDHGTLGIPVRKLTRKSGFKEEQELAELKEMGRAVKEAGGHPFDKNTWRHAAKVHLGWEAVEADLHLELFEAMWQVELIPNLPDIAEDETMAKKLRFAILLCVQLYELHRPRRTSSMDLFNIHQVNTPLVQSPTGEKSKAEAILALGEELQELETDPRQLILESRKKEWTHRLAFCKRRIGDIVALLTELAAGENQPVPRKALDALGFLIAGTLPNGERASRLSDALPGLVGKSVKEVGTYLLDHIVADEARNPQWSSFDVAQSSSSVSPPQKGSPTMVRGAAQNELIVVPHDVARGHSRADFASATIVAASHGACIVCLMPATYAHVIGCSDCTIYIGPVCGVLTIEHSERIRIIGACGRVRLVNCVDIKMNLWTGSRPILLGDCRGIVAGPMCARYPLVTKHCESVCRPDMVISSAFQAWRHPILTDAGGVDEDALEASVFSIQHTDDFAFDPVGATLPTLDPTVEMNLTAEDLAAPAIPAEYAAKLAERKQTVQQCMAMMQDALSKAPPSSNGVSTKAEVQNAVQTAFKDWLMSTGNMDTVASRFIVASGSSSFSE